MVTQTPLANETNTAIEDTIIIEFPTRIRPHGLCPPTLYDQESRVHVPKKEREDDSILLEEHADGIK